MKILPLVLLFALTVFVVQTEAQGKKPGKAQGKKPGKAQGKKPGKKPGKPSKPKCAADTPDMSKVLPYTVTTGKGKNEKPVADQPCWFDLKRNDCAKCKSGGVQCGAPMEKWCQDAKSKTGCPGIPQFKYTLSTTGYPCYWDPESLECAWCVENNVENNVQCKDGSTSDPEMCGRHCKPAKFAKCDGVKTTCENIPKCGPMASCQKLGRTSKCVCKEGYSGNGFQCKDDKTGDWATNSSEEVEMTTEAPAPTPAPVPAAALSNLNITSPGETTSLSNDKVAKAQELCKNAISALDNQDTETAVENLTKALHLVQTGEELE